MTNNYLLLIVQRFPLTLHNQSAAQHMDFVKSSAPSYQLHVPKEHGADSCPTVRHILTPSQLPSLLYPKKTVSKQSSL